MRRWIAGLTTVAALLTGAVVAAPAAHAFVAWNVCYGDGVHTGCTPKQVASNRSPTWSVPVQTGSARLTFQPDCNLVAYDPGYPGGVSWATGTWTIPRPCWLRWQSDGNVVIYDAHNVARWASGTTQGAVGYAMFYNGTDCLVIDRVTTTIWRDHSYCAHP